MFSTVHAARITAAAAATALAVSLGVVAAPSASATDNCWPGESNRWYCHNVPGSPCTAWSATTTSTRTRTPSSAT